MADERAHVRTVREAHYSETAYEEARFVEISEHMRLLGVSEETHDGSVGNGSPMVRADTSITPPSSHSTDSNTHSNNKS